MNETVTAFNRNILFVFVSHNKNRYFAQDPKWTKINLFFELQLFKEMLFGELMPQATIWKFIVNIIIISGMNIKVNVATHYEVDVCVATNVCLCV